LDGDILVDADPEGTDAERFGQRALRPAPHVKIGEDGAAKVLVEGVDVGLAVGIVEGELSFIAVQLHPDPSQVAHHRLGTRRVGCSARLAVLPRQAVDVPEAGTSIVVEGPVGATARPGHPHPPVHDAAQVHLPSTAHLVVFGNGLVGAMHGPEILRLIPQGGLHVLQLGLRGGDAFSALANLRPAFPARKDKSPKP
ncbi:hypothetical protein N301_10071, partial [Charadrius vociferus]